MSYETCKNLTDVKLKTDTKVVILDFDNTCYLYDPCHKAGLDAVTKWFEEKFGLRSDFLEQYKIAKDAVKNRIPNQAASHSRLLYFKILLENVQINDSISNSLEMEQVYWNTFKQTMSPVPGLFDFLALCQENDTKVVVVSDLTTTIQCDKICYLGIASYIDALVTSEEVGIEKPDSKCFNLALEKVGHSADTALVIGDSYERDIVGAMSLGIPSILITHEKPTEKLSTR